MVRLALLLCCWAGPARAEGLLLKGIHTVDPGRRAQAVRDLYIDGGQVAASPQAGQRYRSIDGRGRYVLPALWDLKASLWGNESAKDYHALTQELGIGQCLRTQLFYGVAHVTGTFMERDWSEREIKRAEAMGYAAAEFLYPDLPLGGAGGKRWSHVAVTESASVAAALDARLKAKVPYVQLLFLRPDHPTIPGLSEAMLRESLKGCQARGLRSYVFVDTWARAQQAVEGGADAIHGLPAGPPPDGLARRMAKGHAYFAPALSMFLEPGRLVGNRQALNEAYLADSVPAEIRNSFMDPKNIWEGWREVYQAGVKQGPEALHYLKRFAEAGVPLLSATDSGWSLATFHGYSSISAQSWMQKAGLQPWARLAAATAWPAEFAGRRCGFEAGDPADFIVLGSDPLKSPEALRDIRLIIRSGQAVERPSLKMDLSRTRFKP